MAVVDADLDLWQRITDAAEPRRVQLLNGEIVVNSPLAGHQHLAVQIVRHLLATTPDDRLVLTEMLCTHELDGAPQRAIPDVLVMPRDRFNASASSFSLSDLTLVVEVLSPSTAHLDLGFKRNLYAAAGIPEYWIADPESRVITAYRLNSGEWNEGRPVHINAD